LATDKFQRWLRSHGEYSQSVNHRGDEGDT
jgi:hypothetical protein